MAKLVVLSAELSGRTHELAATTTIGRLEDNAFQILEPSVSSHHCEILLRGQDVIVKDLNSTNGTYINGEKISESPLKPGQILRLGQIELRLDTPTGPDGPPLREPAPPKSASAPPAAPPPSPAGPKKESSTLVMTRGVSLNELEQGGSRGGLGTAGKGFSKKDNKLNKIFLIGGIGIGIIIAGLLIYVFAIAS